MFEIPDTAYVVVSTTARGTRLSGGYTIPLSQRAAGQLSRALSKADTRAGHVRPIMAKTARAWNLM